MKKPDFLVIPIQILENKNLNHSHGYLYGYIYWMEKLKEGACFASNKTLSELMSIGERAIKMYLDDLEREGYIIRIFTDKNKRNRKEIKCTLSFERGNHQFPQGEPPVPSAREMPVPQNNKREKENKNNIYSNASVADTEVSEIINSFKDVNPSYKRMFGNKTERNATKRLIEEHGFEKVKNMVDHLKEIINKPFAPRVTTPYTLEKKLGELKAFVRQERDKNKNLGVIKV